MSIFLAALDVTIVTTALPTISEHFQSTAGYIWIGSAFLLATAASTPTWGKLSDIWGRKPLLLGAVAVFIVGSTLCGAAISIGMLITGRALQGLGAGGLLTLVNIVIGDIFSQRLAPLFNICFVVTHIRQRSCYILRHHWNGLGNSWCNGSRPRWCPNRQSIMALVLLLEL
jgi:MFS family permease